MTRPLMSDSVADRIMGGMFPNKPHRLQPLIDKINAAGSDNHEFFGGTWTGGYHIQQDPQEFAELVELLQGFKFENYLVIGIAAGGVERFLVENCDIGSLVIIDDGSHPAHKHWEANKPKDFNNFFVDEFIGDSHSKSAREFLERFEEGEDPCMTAEKFNLVGIDGDHSPQGVLQDWELVQPYLAPNALVWFHDTSIDIPGQSGARKLVARLEKQYEVLLQTNGKFGITVLRVP